MRGGDNGDKGPREKLLAGGPAALSDPELLALFLRTGIRGRAVLDVARDILDTYGGIRGLLDLGAGALGARGVGPVSYCQLAGALELTKRYLLTGVRRGYSVADPADARLYLQARLSGYKREVFAVVFLDNQHRAIEYEELFFGTIDGASVHPREVVKRVLEHNAAAVIFAHNHPSGVAEPSLADRRITERLQRALALVDVRVLDHMVIGDAEVVSFAERGLL